MKIKLTHLLTGANKHFILVIQKILLESIFLNLKSKLHQKLKYENSNSYIIILLQ